ncbi:alpha/beta fold hydrolase [Microbacterium gorillae]|uniref:alpha/beta fold hydrolase n=1 Tax=Microbacterium gorillae TaxID=1231063 RepID=UPI000694E487|nr:alpha/beta fold hydrolase [Microbacterium gorillae]
MTVPALAFTPVIGDTDAPLVVLGCSLGTSTALWESTIPRLLDRYRVVTWDLPGHGDSPAARAPFTVAELADAVAAGVDELGASRFHYAGVSLGGATGLELLIRHPGRVAAAAIVASSACFGGAEAWRARADLVRASSTADLVEQSATRWFTPAAVDVAPELVARLLQDLRDADDDSYALCCEALAAYDVRADLSGITAPVLALWGASDPVVGEASAREIADGVRTGTSAPIPDAAHLPPVERPAEVAAHLNTFSAAHD